VVNPKGGFLADPVGQARSRLLFGRLGVMDSNHRIRSQSPLSYH
jgi:hypothetical protein